MIYLRLPTRALPPPQPRVFPLPSPSLDPAHPPPALSPAPNPPGGGRPARRAERKVDAAPVAPSVSVGRNVDPAAAAAHALRPLCRQPYASLSFIPWPACARTCWNRTERRALRSARRAARALLLRPLDQRLLFLRDAHAPVVVQIAIWTASRGENEHLLSTRPRQLACARPSARGRPH
jgi:hypothetical protein